VELSAEVEADFARTMGPRKIAKLRGLLLEMSGTLAREVGQNKNFARTPSRILSLRLISEALEGSGESLPSSESDSLGFFYNRRKPHLLMA